MPFASLRKNGELGRTQKGGISFKSFLKPHHMILENKNCWAYDFETYPNLVTMVARKFGTKEYEKFVIHESHNDSQKLIDWLATKPVLVGFANLMFDGQITEHIIRHGKEFTAEFIYDFVQTLPIADKSKDRYDTPYSEWDMSCTQLDLQTINHYDRAARDEEGGMTSLKWLEFTTRWGKLRDLPFDPTKEVSRGRIKDVVRYNTNDVDVTYDFAYKCAPMIELRNDLAKRYKQKRMLNMSDSSLGSYIFEHILTRDYGMSKAELKKGTYYDEIHGKDVLLPYIDFENEAFKTVLHTFKTRTYKNKKGGQLTNVAGGEYEQVALFEDMAVVFGSGGLHACHKAGEFESDEDHIILSIDVASYYPNLAIKNKIFPKHIGSKFCDIYEGVYRERQTHEKGTSLNYALKIALNSVYGKSNSKHSLFNDLMYLLKITVNGQLLLAMLAEKLAKLGRILMINTDGLEIRIPRNKLDEARAICMHWEMLTELELEENLYDKLVIRDVNNYIAVDVKGKAKRKGMFEVYDDITEIGGKPHAYHKSPNATIIPQALFDYYVGDKSIEETINSCNDIYNFCHGIKKQKGFDYWLITAQDGGVIDIAKRTDRVLRYYISPGGANIFKFWKDGRDNNVQGVNRGQLVSLAMNIGSPDIQRIKKGVDTTVYEVDKQYYIGKAYEIVDHINNGTRDHAYERYMKDLANNNK
jgi:hypothetical protein